MNVSLFSNVDLESPSKIVRNGDHCVSIDLNSAVWGISETPFKKKFALENYLKNFELVFNLQSGSNQNFDDIFSALLFKNTDNFPIINFKSLINEASDIFVKCLHI